MRSLEIFPARSALIIIAVLLGPFDSCTTSPFRFNLTNIYTRDRFSGRELGGHCIGICPLLTADGPVIGPRLPSTGVMEKFRKERPDLQLRDADIVHTALSSVLSPVVLKKYYRLLFEGDVISLQTADSLWRAAGTDYMLVTRLRHGMDIRTFNQQSEKRINLEAELWDCTAMETAWRVSVVGICNRAGFSDQKFLIEAFGEIAAALPSVVPSYDTKSW